MKVIVQKWEESERGWGTRPDGYSVHPSEDSRSAYLKEYWDKLPDEVPDEYSRPCGTPYEADVDVEFDGELGIRFWDNKYPGSGGADGWVAMRS